MASIAKFDVIAVTATFGEYPAIDTFFKYYGNVSTGQLSLSTLFDYPFLPQINSVIT